MTDTATYRVWFHENQRQYELVEAPDRDAVYRRFKSKKRATISRVDLVPTSSTHRALSALGTFLRAGAPKRRRAA